MVEGTGASRRRRTPQQRREEHAAVDDPAAVLEAASRLLEARPRSEVEVRRRLVRSGYRPELVDGAVTRLTELGILDDAAFARAWVDSRDRARPRGERALRQELRLKGIDASTVDEVLAERRSADTDDRADDAGPVDPDRVAADRLLDRHARSLARVADPRIRRQRAYALLARNGFDPSVAGDAARSWLARDAHADGDEAEPIDA
jgi:regulatory protein